MAKSSKKNTTENITVEGELQSYVGYSTYYCSIPLFNSFRLSNIGADAVERLTVSISGDTPLVLPSDTEVDVLPGESSTEISCGNLLNPKYLAELDAVTQCVVSVRVSVGKNVVRSFDAPVKAVPMNYWSGLGGNVEMLASVVRPTLNDCQKIKVDAGLDRMAASVSVANGSSPLGSASSASSAKDVPGSERGVSGQGSSAQPSLPTTSAWRAYESGGKTAVKEGLAKIYAAIKKLSIEREKSSDDFSECVDCGDVSAVLAGKSASQMGMALFVASCLESVKANPVIVIGRDRVAVGCWLYESCFSLPVQDDMGVLERYAAVDVGNISCFDISDIFAHKNASYDVSEGHFLSALVAGKYEQCLDIKRARIDGIYPMPLKVKRGDSYELLGEAQLSSDVLPKQIIDASKFELGKKLGREDNWKRRLLDLSQKNNLLNFRYKGDALHIQCADIDNFVTKVDFVSRFSLLPATQSMDVPFFGASGAVKSLGELISIEMNSGKMRIFGDGQALTERAQSMIRRANQAQEEVGSSTLYLAIGFLQWKPDDEKEFRYAPVCLLPVTLKRSKQVFYMECSDDYQPNSTLLEYLHETFGIDVRGLEGRGLAPSEIIAAVRAGTCDKKGWTVHDDVYVAQFTFTRFAMWQDLASNMDDYKGNRLIASLISNSNLLEGEKASVPCEDDSDPRDVLLPLPSDSSQYEAVAQSMTGTTFVLHGPPGTGKSQTITNMIANAIDKGRRVLFVAEKQAAIKVVKKRLTDLGIGDFCLELHSGKTDKNELLRSVDDTLALSSSYESSAFDSTADKISDVRECISAPMRALHRRRPIGVSIYDAIVIYLQNKNAPELMDVESTFYDSLTRQKIDECESMIITAQTAARECGGVYRSPFDNVSLIDCGEGVSEEVECLCEVTLCELKRYKNYLSLFLDKFNQKVSTFTLKKLTSLREVVALLSDSSLEVYFNCPEDRLQRFYNACVKYDRETSYWLSKFKNLPEIGKIHDEAESEMENWGDNYRSSRVVLQVLKKINKCGPLSPVKEEDEPEWINRACEIERAADVIRGTSEFSSQFTGFGGSINEKKRVDFLRPLYKLHSLCGQIFMDYNADSFNSVCSRVIKYNNAASLFAGLTSAGNDFLDAVKKFNARVGLDENRISDEDVLEYYSSKCASLLDNIDMLPAWCLYKNTAKKLVDSGLKFMADAMESGVVSGDDVIASFRKNVYRNFIRTNIPADETLCSFSAALLDEDATSLSHLLDNFARLTREKIRADLISRLPRSETEGAVATELMTYRRKFKGNVRSFKIRDLFTETPNLMKLIAPCVMMSPSTVSQYLPKDTEMFDLVIFDEASQVPTCEAVGALARGKSAVIVGDPNQMPPTSFFAGASSGDEFDEDDDMESILADCLSLGIPERHLTWHYRSKHESLIAFSNVMYYGSRLCTFPSPDALDSKVALRYMESGVYDRGGRKINAQEADALVSEVVSRLKDERRKNQSIGIVTFSSPQQEYIERKLSKVIYDNKLEAVAYEREEPLFVKNLENVQGDERDVILFSVCYGPDRMGKLSLNFGPLNQYGGWRRLNVAVSRAREEMIVFSSMRYSQIDLSRTSARGVAGLKAFLEFAEKGRTNIAPRSDELIINRNGIGKYVAKEIENLGYECRCDVGVSDFKIDVGVIDPKNKHNFILAVLCDGSDKFSTKDRTVMQVQTLKRNNWNVVRLYSLNFFNNPKREIKKIKDYLDRLTGADGKGSALTFRKPYKTAKLEIAEKDSAYLLDSANDADIVRTIKAIVAAEEPISYQLLVRRTFNMYGVSKWGVKVENRIRLLIEGCGFVKCEMLGCVYVMKADKFRSYDRYRVEEKAPFIRVADFDFTPYDVISLVKSILLNKVSMYADELATACLKELKITRGIDKFESYVFACIDEGVREGLFIKSVADKISLA